MVGTVIDKVEIVEILARFDLAVDSDDIEAYAALWTENAVMEMNGTTARGQEALRAFFVEHRKTLGRGRRHLSLNPVVLSAEGDSATATSYMVVIEAEKAPAVVASGVYSDTLQRVDGRWKFAGRKLDVDPSRQATSATNTGGSAMTDKAKVPAAISSAIIKEDWDGVRAGLADDIVYKPGSRDEIHGADNTLEALKTMFTQVAKFTGHKVRQIWEAEGVDGVAIEMDAYYRRIKDNKDFVITCTDIYRLKGDKIGEWRVNADISPLLLD